MYETACRSTNYIFCMRVVQILKRISMSHPSCIQCGWSTICFWDRGDHFNIRVDHLDNLSIDLERIRWHEQLKVRFFHSHGTSPNRMTSDGTMTLNRWVYNSVIPIDRVMGFERRTHASSRGWLFGMPQLPWNYRILSYLEGRPTYFISPVLIYHTYIWWTRRRLIILPFSWGKFCINTFCWSNRIPFYFSSFVWKLFDKIFLLKGVNGLH